MDLKNVSISVTLSSILAIGTSFATFSYNQGAQNQDMENYKTKIAVLETGFQGVADLKGSIDLLRQDVGYMRNEFADLKEQTNRMSQDMTAVNLYIAKQEGAQEALKRISGGLDGNR